MATDYLNQLFGDVRHRAASKGASARTLNAIQNPEDEIHFHRGPTIMIVDDHVDEDPPDGCVFSEPLADAAIARLLAVGDDRDQHGTTGKIHAGPGHFAVSARCRDSEDTIVVRCECGGSVEIDGRIFEQILTPDYRAALVAGFKRLKPSNYDAMLRDIYSAEKVSSLVRGGTVASSSCCHAVYQPGCSGCAELQAARYRESFKRYAGHNLSPIAADMIREMIVPPPSDDAVEASIRYHLVVTQPCWNGVATIPDDDESPNGPPDDEKTWKFCEFSGEWIEVVVDDEGALWPRAELPVPTALEVAGMERGLLRVLLGDDGEILVDPDPSNAGVAVVPIDEMVIEAAGVRPGEWERYQARARDLSAQFRAVALEIETKVFGPDRGRPDRASNIVDVRLKPEAHSRLLAEGIAARARRAFASAPSIGWDPEEV
jgi:hypothetical protein